MEKKLSKREAHPDANDYDSVYGKNLLPIDRLLFWRSWKRFTNDSLHIWRHRISGSTGSSPRQKKIKSTAVDMNPTATIAPPSIAVDEVYDPAKSIITLQKALNRLPKEMHLVIHYRFIACKSVRDTAKELDITEAAVRTIQYRALRKIRHYTI